MNQDFDLCADFGTADKVRQHCAGWSAEALGKAAAAFYCYIRTGVISAIPFTHFALWAKMNPEDKSKHDQVYQVVADTLYTMCGEARQTEHPGRFVVAREGRGE